MLSILFRALDCSCSRFSPYALKNALKFNIYFFKEVKMSQLQSRHLMLFMVFFLPADKT